MVGGRIVVQNGAIQGTSKNFAAPPPASSTHRRLTKSGRDAFCHSQETCRYVAPGRRSCGATLPIHKLKEGPTPFHAHERKPHVYLWTEKGGAFARHNCRASVRAIA